MLTSRTSQGRSALDDGFQRGGGGAVAAAGVEIKKINFRSQMFYTTVTTACNAKAVKVYHGGSSRSRRRG